MPEHQYDVEALLRTRAEGRQLKFLFFWGHTPGRVGEPPGKECLSQWYPARFVLDGLEFLSAEHFMMHEKARLFGDQAAASRILRARHPGEAKQLGRSVRGFVEQDWSAERFAIVVRGSVAKFSQNPELGSFLSCTAGRVLVEASPRDGIWGIGVSETDERAHDPERWPGLNLLGFALMRARATLLNPT